MSSYTRLPDFVCHPGFMYYESSPYGENYKLLLHNSKATVSAIFLQKATTHTHIHTHTPVIWLQAITQNPTKRMGYCTCFKTLASITGAVDVLDWI